MPRPGLLVALFLLWAGTLAAQTRQEIMDRGKDAFNRQDFKAATASFTELIDRDKQDLEAFYWRAFSRHGAGEFETAIFDYTWTISLARMQSPAAEPDKPWLAHLHANRGKARQDRLDFEGALADYNTALALKPDDNATLLFRGGLKILKMDLTGAMADAEAILKLMPDQWHGYQQRGMVRQGQGDFRGAMADFREVARREAKHATYMQFFIWGLRCRLGEAQAANDELAAHMKTRAETQAGDWEAKVGAYLLGQLGDTEFLAAAETPDPMKRRAQECEARYYQGLKKLLAGDRAAASEDFRAAQATGMIYFTEYALAGFELAAR